MIDIQLLNDALSTLAFIVGLVVVIAIWVVAASAVHQRQERKIHVRAVERHLADVADQQSPVPTR